MVMIGGSREIAKNRDLEDSGLEKNRDVHQHFEIGKNRDPLDFWIAKNRDLLACCC